MFKNIHMDKKKVLLIAGIVLGVLAVIYIGFSVFFMNHFYFRTTMNGMPVSGCSVAKVQEKTKASVDSYSLSIIDRDGNEDTIKGQDISLKPEWDDSLGDMLKKQSGFGWIGALFHSNELKGNTLVEYDESALSEFIKELDCMDAEKQVEPVDATISSYDAKKGFEIVPSKEGTAIDEKKLSDTVEEAVNGLTDELDLAEEACYKEPKVKEDNEDLIAAVDTLNTYCKSVINYKIGDQTQTLDASTFASWLKVDENLEPSIDQTALEDYVSSLSKTYNTCYTDETLKTSYGTTVTIGNVHYGWKVDKAAEAEAILSDIKGGATVERDLNYSMTAASHGANDYGDSYVEINLTAQHLFLYKNGQMILESDVITGKPDGQHETPPGVFGITYCEKDATLRGANYATPVAYWMPFNGDIGLHDATWQSVFGAAYYLTKGSHGCVNLPLGVAKTIFENVEAGFPVLVYDLPGTESETAKSQFAAREVVKAIKQIGDVTPDKEGQIAGVRAQYDALTEEGKSFVNNYDVLVNAETVINQNKADQAAALQAEQAALQQQLQNAANNAAAVN